MKRILITLLVAAAVLIPTTEAQANWRHDRCRYASRDGEAGWSKKEVKLTIACATDHWSVPGGYDEAFAVASCESGLDPWAGYPDGHAKGVYQFLDSTWDSVTDRWSGFMERWDLGGSVYNGRSNVLLAIRKAHADSWSAWSCAG